MCAGTEPTCIAFRTFRRRRSTAQTNMRILRHRMVYCNKWGQLPNSHPSTLVTSSTLKRSERLNATTLKRGIVIRHFIWISAVILLRTAPSQGTPSFFLQRRQGSFHFPYSSFIGWTDALIFDREHTANPLKLNVLLKFPQPAFTSATGSDLIERIGSSLIFYPHILHSATISKDVALGYTPTHCYHNKRVTLAMSASDRDCIDVPCVLTTSPFMLHNATTALSSHVAFA